MLVEDVGPISRTRSDSCVLRCLSSSFHPLEWRGTRLPAAPLAPLELSLLKRLRMCPLPFLLCLRLQDESFGRSRSRNRRCLRHRSRLTGARLQLHFPFEHGALFDGEPTRDNVSRERG